MPLRDMKRTMEGQIMLGKKS